MKRGIQLLKDPASLDTTLFVLSNANTFFINTILQHQGIRGCFDTIFTNPADFSDPDHPHQLVLSRRVGPSDPPQGLTAVKSDVRKTCARACQALTCYLDARRADPTEFDRVIYVGDDNNNLCAVLRLRSQDVVLCRRFRGIERTIANECARGPASRLRCTVEHWSGAWEVEEKFKAYAQRTSSSAVNW